MPARRHILVIFAIAMLLAMDGNAAKPAKAPDMSGVWALTDTVDSSTCSGIKPGDRRAMLLTIDQTNTEDDSGETGHLTVSATGSSPYQKYEGKTGGTLGSEFELDANVGVATSKLTGKYTKKKLSGTRREVASNSCTVMSTFAAKQL